MTVHPPSGDTVVRPIGEWSKSVHGLLNHLQAVGFSRAPRLIKTDLIHGKEILTYIDGEVAMRPWPLILLSKAGIVAIAQLLREYHDLIRNYRPGANSKWRDPNAKWQEGMIVRHGDLGPWNMVWKSSELVGLIDWDLAEPGYPIEDVAQAAWYCQRAGEASASMAAVRSASALDCRYASSEPTPSCSQSLRRRSQVSAASCAWDRACATSDIKTASSIFAIGSPSSTRTPGS